VRRRGRPTKLSQRQVAQVRRWAAQGWTHQAIAERFGVARSVVSTLLARVGPAQDALDLGEEADGEEADGEEADGEEAAGEEAAGEEAAGAGSDGPGLGGQGGEEATGTEASAEPGLGSARIGDGTRPCRYAGATLLYSYLGRVGAGEVFATLSGGPGRLYDDLAVLATATLSFALGAATVEGVKHLRRGEMGAAVGLAAIPELRTLRSRLAALGDGSDPLALQRTFAKNTMAFDPAGMPVYFVDDHFVAYSGAAPLAKGWNTKRRHAAPGRADTALTDIRGRAVCFTSDEPGGLTKGLIDVVAQLREVIGPDGPITLGFDRGGSYPVTFAACRSAGADWVTYRRAPLVATNAEPRRSWTIRDNQRITLMLADETVELKGYGTARQLTVFEAGAPVLQVLTSDTTATAAALVCWLRARWRIENAFKYLSAHNGIDSLADYRMDIGPDGARVPNPARRVARQGVSDATEGLAAAERALAQLLAGPASATDKNLALPALSAAVEAATDLLEASKAALKPIPARIAATDLDPGAKRARSRIERRGLQMVCRLLAYNAEAWLAERLNAYVADLDEYRALTRNLLHLGGTITYTPHAVTVTLDRPDTPRIARALELLTEELNNTPSHIPGDDRTLTYHIASAHPD